VLIYSFNDFFSYSYGCKDHQYHNNNEAVIVVETMIAAAITKLLAIENHALYTM